jgi:hypothetical protein
MINVRTAIYFQFSENGGATARRRKKKKKDFFFHFRRESARKMINSLVNAKRERERVEWSGNET